MVQGFYKGFITQAWLIDSLATGDLAQSLAPLPSQREVGGGGKESSKLLIKVWSFWQPPLILKLQGAPW